MGANHAVVETAVWDDAAPIVPNLDADMTDAPEVIAALALKFGRRTRWAFAQLQSLSPAFAALAANAVLKTPPGAALQSIAGPVTVNGNLQVNGTIGSISNLVVGTDNSGHATVHGNVTLDGGVYLTDNAELITYSSTPRPSRTKVIGASKGAGLGGQGVLLFRGTVWSADSNLVTIAYPLELPLGAELLSVQAVVLAANGACRLRVWKQTMNWASPPANPAAIGNSTQLGGTASTTSTSPNAQPIAVLMVTPYEVIANASTTYTIEVAIDAVNDRSYGVRVNYSDPGPRNH